MFTEDDLKFLIKAEPDVRKVEEALAKIGKEANGAFSPLEQAMQRVVKEMNEVDKIANKVKIDEAFMRLTGKVLPDMNRQLSVAEEAMARIAAETDRMAIAEREAKVVERVAQMKGEKSPAALKTETEAKGKVAGAAQQASSTVDTVIGRAGPTKGGAGVAMEAASDAAGIVAAVTAGDVAGAVKTAIKMQMDMIASPFKAMAEAASEAATRLNELQGPLGAVGQGMEHNAQVMERIPLIGSHLAAAERSAKQMAETNLNFMRELQPAFGAMLDQVNADVRALKANSKQAYDVLETNRQVADVLATLQKHGEANAATIEQQMGLKPGEKWMGWRGGDESKGGLSRSEIQKQNLDAKLQYQREVESGKKEWEEMNFQTGRIEKKGVAEKYEELYGHKLEKGAGAGAAARPAQFSSFMDYERQLQQRAFSQGVDPQTKSAKFLEDIYNLMKSKLPGAGTPVGDAALRTMNAVAEALQGLPMFPR